ncbi:D-alanyl-D-alanine carboxypeptidase/D-alanyl-D-alanine endopeptidase [Ruegeria hyattellae]|uniref:D-alanyl-D-alanine carboxypeptidase/D-alanyl-D-alanine endopeptidase n=1 Tax=Ruegeria hyattellae TaxID=3233337 RepID=UPI00355BE25C
MRSHVSRRAFLGGAASLALGGPALAAAPQTSLRPQARVKRSAAERVIASSGLSGEVAYAVGDASTGEILETVGGEVRLPPASVAKGLTALYALAALGPDHRYETRLIADGRIENGVLHGNLILAGGCDPTLDTEALAQMAKQLRESGLHEVRGIFKVYNGALPHTRSIDPDQPDHLGYSPAVSGIALNYNRVHFEWKRGVKGYAVTMDARTKNYRPQVGMARMQVVNRRVPVYTYDEAARLDKWTVASQALGNGGARWLPVRKPAHYAGDVFQTLARVNGIVLGKVNVTQARSGGAILVRHQSAPLVDILRGMLKYSNNLTAEMVGMSATSALFGRPASLPASAKSMSDWAAETYGMQNTLLVDHSGLGDGSRMAPEDLVRALVAAKKVDELQPLLKRFPMRDSEGRENRAHPIRVAAKTGTLNFVSALGGYATGADGRDLAFAIFTADMEKRGKIARADREVPPGARAWNRRSRRLQQKLIERWGALYGS